jgi:hypothetical protein
VWLIDGPLFPNRVSGKCPVIMFASVSGRIRFLSVWMITINCVNPLNL